MEDTYNKPPHGWTCFFCGETFTTVGSARTHFGASKDCKPGCLLKVQLGGERGLLMALRKTEEELAAYYNDNIPLVQEIARIQSKHSDHLLEAEERGYERGLAEAKTIG